MADRLISHDERRIMHKGIIIENDRRMLQEASELIDAAQQELANLDSQDPLVKVNLFFSRLEDLVFNMCSTGEKKSKKEDILLAHLHEEREKQIAILKDLSQTATKAEGHLRYNKRRLLELFADYNPEGPTIH